MHIVLPILILVFTYLALSADVSPANLVIGLLVAGGILAAVRPHRTVIHWRRLPGSLAAVFIYTIRLLYNMFRSGIQMVRIILDPKLPLKSGIVAIPSGCESDLGRALSAHAISLPPGELFIEMAADGTLFIHSLDVETTLAQAGAAQETQRTLINKIFE